jgi:hypothetical protein
MLLKEEFNKGCIHAATELDEGVERTCYILHKIFHVFDLWK